MMTCCSDAEAVETPEGVEAAQAAEMRAPLKPDLRMVIYNDSNGIETDAVWRTEQQYQAVAAFFKKLLGKTGIMPGDPGKPDFVFVETQEQMDAFWNFTQTLTKPPA
jgi:hypothetical protein